MTKTSVLFLLVLITMQPYCQADTIAQPESIKTDYLQKSKTQKTIAWIMLTAGTAMLAGGIITGRNSVDDASIDEAFDGGALIVGGLVVDLASIPLFIAASNNKKKGLSLTFKK